MFIAFTSVQSKAQGTGTCPAPTVISTGIDGASGDFYFEMPAQPGDFFVVQLTKADGSQITAKCQSTPILSGIMKVYVPTGVTYGTVSPGDVACIAKYCHSISQWCYQNDNDYGAFAPCVVIGGQSPGGNKKPNHGHH